jgi:DNA adenine methylase
MGYMKNRVVAFNYFGGKTTICKEIEELMPPHRHYVEVFGGSMAVALNKRPAPITTVNDVNGEVINFFRVLRERPAELAMALALTPVSRAEYAEAWEKVENDLERARRFYTRIRQSFYGLGAGKKSKGWHFVKTIYYSLLPENVNKWRNGIEGLLQIAEIISAWQIECLDFRKLISVIDFEEAFFYCDPPYPKEARSSFNDYANEMSNQDHEELATALHSIKGLAMVSGYECPLMEELYAGWYKHLFRPTRGNIRNAERQECVWMNYNPKFIQKQLTII